MTSRPRLLWHSNAPWVPTGYGQQTALFAPPLAGHYDLAISAFFGLSGASLKYAGVPVYPGTQGGYGNEQILGHARRHFNGDPRGGLTVTLMDVWVLDTAIWDQLDLACWVPVDHDPVPPMVHSFFARTSAIPIAMSQFGAEQLAAHDPLYVPHAVDTTTYRPHDRAESRRIAGIPKDAFVVGAVAANKGQPSRKSYPEILQAFAALRQARTDAILYLHCDATGQAHGGLNLPMILRSLGVPPDAVMLADQYRLQHNPLAPEVMARIYASMDVLINPARGEGFGVPILEAAACGIPAIVTDFSAMPEVAGPGWKVTGDPEWSGQMSWQARPRLDELVHALTAAYDMPAKDRRALAAKARAHAEAYDISAVMAAHMLPALAEARDRLAPRTIPAAA